MSFYYQTIVVLVLFLLTGCSAIDRAGSVVPDLLEKVGYQQNIQQGNVITQAQVNRLLPNMSKQQVRYLLGTPMLVDTFHQNRWDFMYTLKEGRKKAVQKHFSVFFDDNKLTRIEGDYAPQDKSQAQQIKKNELVVSVPDYIPPNRGLITRFLEWIGILKTDNT